MKSKSSSAAFVPAGLLIGMGIGFLAEAFLAGLFIGLGSGILLMTIYEIKTKSDK